jgi:hypothetical protein
MAIMDESSSTRTYFVRSLRRFGIDNIALLLPFIGALVFFLRCIVVSKGNRYMAFLLMTQTSIGDALRALLISGIILMLIAVWIVAAYVAVKWGVSSNRDGPFARSKHKAQILQLDGVRRRILRLTKLCWVLRASLASK